MTKLLLKGQVLSFAGDPFREGLEVARHDRRGAVLVTAGKVAAVGPAEALAAAHPEAEVTE
jgi:guanine deaminase